MLRHSPCTFLKKTGAIKTYSLLVTVFLFLLFIILVVVNVLFMLIIIIYSCFMLDNFFFIFFAKSIGHSDLTI